MTASPNIYAICVAQNEADVIAESARWASRFCEHVWVWDLGSTDDTSDRLRKLDLPNVTVQRRNFEPFVNSIRGRFFQEIRDRVAAGSWMYVLDPDEFFVGDPHPVLREAEKEGKGVVGVWQVNFLPTEEDASELRTRGETAWAALPLERRLTHYRVEWFEHRFVHVVPGFSWDFSGLFSVWRDGAGRKLSLSRHFGFVRHYRYRSPSQVLKRYGTRTARSNMGDTMFTWTDSGDFFRYVRPASRLCTWNPDGGELVVPWIEQQRARAVWTWTRAVHFMRRRLNALRAPARPSTERSLPNAPFLLRCIRGFIQCLPRGRHKIVRWITPWAVNRPPFKARFDGGKQFFVAALSNRVARGLFFYGFYEQVQTAVLVKILRPGQVVIDVGANIGYFSLLAARRVGSAGRVIAFEPEPGNAALLRQNIALNGYQNARVEEVAIGAAEGRVRLSAGRSDSREGDTCSTVFEKTDSLQSIIDVPVVALDPYCRTYGIDRVDILKMDIEGGEANALDGMRQGIREGKYRRVFLELHPAQLRMIGRNPQEILAAFLEHGYACWRMLNCPPGVLNHYSTSYHECLLSPYRGMQEDEYWPHFFLTAKDVSLADD